MTTTCNASDNSLICETRRTRWKTPWSSVQFLATATFSTLVCKTNLLMLHILSSQARLASRNARHVRSSAAKSRQNTAVASFFSTDDGGNVEDGGGRRGASSDASSSVPGSSAPKWPTTEEIKKAANPHWREEAADDLLARGHAALLKNEYNDAADCFRESLHVIGKVDTLKFSASAKNSLNALGIIHLLRGDLALARERLDHAQTLQDNISSSGFGDDAFRDRAGLLNDYAALEMHDGNLDAAFKLLKQCAYTIGRAYKVSQLSHAVLYANFGELMYLKREYESSVNYFEKSCLHLRECKDGDTVCDFIGSNIRATAQASMAKSLRANLLTPEDHPNMNAEDLELANLAELQTCRTLMSEACHGLDNDSGRLNYIYIRSQQGSLAWALGEHDEARDYFFDAYFTSLKTKDQGVVDNEIFLIAQNNASLFHHDIDEAEKLLQSCLDIMEVETSPSKVERIDVVKNVAQRNLLAVRNKRGINSTELGQQSNLNEQAPSQPYYETFRVGSETELFKLNHSSYVLGSGITSNLRPSEFSFSGYDVEG